MTDNIEVLRGLVAAAEKVNALSIVSEAHKELRVALPGAKAALAAMGGQGEAHTGCDMGVLCIGCEPQRKAGACPGAAQPESRVGGEVEVVAWLYTLEYGGHVANTKVSKHQLSYPFGVCGSDYLARNDEGVSYVRQTPLYTTPPPSAVPEGMVLVRRDDLESLAGTDFGKGYWNNRAEIAAMRVRSLLTAAPEPGEG